MVILQPQGMLCCVFLQDPTYTQAGVLNCSRRDEMTPDLLLRGKKGGGDRDMECSLTRNTQRRRERGMFLIHGQRQAGRFFNAGSPPTANPGLPLSQGAHKYTHKMGTKGG
jgi:hypothetical protein